MQAPRKAIVLAAGFGTRMQPLTQSVPKAVLPFWDVPVAIHVLRLLSDWGVRDVLLNLHHLPSPVVEAVCRRIPTGLRVSFSFEPELEGTGGALRRGAWFISEGPLWLVNADIVADLDPDPLLKEFRDRAPLAVLWVTGERGPRTVVVRRGTVRSFNAPVPGAPGTHTFCGLHLLDPDLVRYVKPRGPDSVIAAYRHALRRRRSIRAVAIADSFWRDIGTPSDYLRAHAEALEAYRHGARGARLVDPSALRRMATLQRGGVRISGFVSAAPSAVVERGARLQDTVVSGGALLGGTTDSIGAVIGPGVHTRGTVRGVVVRGEDADNPAVVRAAERMGWPLASVTAAPLPARGSDRRFTRLFHGHESVILVQYGTERRENARFAGHARFLREAGVPVPGVLVDLPRERIVVTEDAGHPLLSECARALPAAAWRRTYRHVLEAVHRLHTRGTRRARRRRLRLEPRFDRSLYAWEHDLFVSRFLRDRLGWRGAAIDRVRDELSIVASRLLQEPLVLIHRDCQSENIVLSRSGPVFLDFQGMRYGPAFYDLASLICDPYVELTEAQQGSLVELCRVPGPRREARFWTAAVQRLVQALGAYARLSTLPGTAAFARHIPAGLRMLERALARVDNTDALAHAVRVAQEKEAGS